MSAIFDSSTPYGGGGYDPYARAQPGLQFYGGGGYGQDAYAPSPSGGVGGRGSVSTPALEGSISGAYTSGVSGGSGGVGGRVGGEMTLWDALTTGGFPDEPGLLEELGINLNHIRDKTLTVLSPFHSYSSNHPRDAHMMDDADLAGPFIFCMLFGTMLLLAGKSQFGYIYGLGVLGDISIYLLLNMMLEDGIDMYRVSSVLGYCILPLCIPAFVGLFIQLNYWYGYIFAALSILWCASSASGIFVSITGMSEQRLLVAYPLGLFYTCFAMLSVFNIMAVKTT